MSGLILRCLYIDTSIDTVNLRFVSFYPVVFYFIWIIVILLVILCIEDFFTDLKFFYHYILIIYMYIYIYI